MAIKIDLEKAYDRVRWDFIDKSIQAVGIPEYLRKVIMLAITMATIQVLWNGVPTEKFKPARGIRQGCPLSPYLFILCMEWLGQSFQSSISSKEWTPIKLSRAGPNLCHLFLADDLVIFSKADIKHEEDLSHRLSGILGYQKVQELGKYLGIPLFHKRITKSTMQFVVDKVRSKLGNWDAKQLSIAGHFTLVQSIILTVPNYLMQSIKIPKGFIWGTSTGGRKLALVDWGTICQPRTCGGLGLRRLQEQNSSFLLKL
ncbi:Retrovirus-related Pol polyprotein LINE-1 [Gossypium australe]|uniref:Retrovirus-related Pol polyprotein LINE-1 n=1 Tax=Gossypium australe TaxID=47621 RepID=A0A5B6W056_9ROSI|nr:Retrovirus-related Pol polyprotein LINE-1 [Gossypium australe]